MSDIALALFAGLLALAGFVAGAFVADRFKARATDRIRAMNEVFRTWGDHIVNDAAMIKADGAKVYASLETQIAEREAAFKAWVATL